MIIKIRARHFVNAVFVSPFDCPLARAVADTLSQFGMPYTKIQEGINRVTIHTHDSIIECGHEVYGSDDYISDRSRIIVGCLRGDEVIRTITLRGFPPEELSTKTPLEVVEEEEFRMKIQSCQEDLRHRLDDSSF